VSRVSSHKQSSVLRRYQSDAHRRYQLDGRSGASHRPEKLMGYAMALKDLLVYVDQSERAVSRLRLAADLARRHESRLIAIYVRELSPAQILDESTAELGLGSAKAIDRANDRI
jgi:hypothetical protein